MEVVATAKWVRTTARKARLVAATIEGLSVADALTILAFTPRFAAIEVAKVIKSAAANAEHNYNLDVSTLRVARIEIDGATVIKRFQPRAQGRAFSILKRTSHLRAVVSDDGVVQERQRRRRAPAAAAAPAPAAEPAPRRRTARPARPKQSTTEGTAPAAAEAEAE
jgi:large subunit ribosomal protein L22